MTNQHIVFLTGAGISAESGLSTFRGKNGLWTNEEWVPRRFIMTPRGALISIILGESNSRRWSLTMPIG